MTWSLLFYFQSKDTQNKYVVSVSVHEPVCVRWRLFKMQGAPAKILPGVPTCSDWNNLIHTGKYAHSNAGSK